MAIDASAYPIEFRLLPVTRGGYIGGGILLEVSGLGIAGLSTIVFASSLTLALLLLVGGLAFSIYGVVGLIRWPGMSLTLTEREAFVRGMFRSRSIDRDRVVGIGPYPSIRWTDNRGKIRSTAINVLNIYRRSAVLPEVLRNNARQVAMLTEWASRDATTRY